MSTINLSRGAQQDLEQFEGDSTKFTVAFFEDDLVTQDSITGWDFVLTIVSKDTCEANSNNQQVVNIGSGLTILPVPDDNTLDVNFILGVIPGYYRYSLVGTDTDDVVVTWLYGNFKVNANT